MPLTTARKATETLPSITLAPRFGYTGHRCQNSVSMSTTLRVRPTLLRELGKIAAKSDQDVSELVEDTLRKFVRSHRETAHLTSTKANVRRLRSAHAEIETEIARRRRKAA